MYDSLVITYNYHLDLENLRKLLYCNDDDVIFKSVGFFFSHVLWAVNATQVTNAFLLLSISTEDRRFQMTCVTTTMHYKWFYFSLMLFLIFNYTAWAECLCFIQLIGAGVTQAGKLQMWARGRVFGKGQSACQHVDCFKAMLTVIGPFIY